MNIKEIKPRIVKFYTKKEKARKYVIKNFGDVIKRLSKKR